MDRRLWVVIAVLALAGAACAKNAGSDTDEPQPQLAPVRVEVVSHYALPMEVFVTGAGSTFRLGTVAPEMTRTFTVPQNLLAKGTAEFRAQPTARGPVFRSGEILLSPGAFVDFMITPQLFNSTVTIRP